MIMKYGVTLPVTGYAYIEVEADNREEALDKAHMIVEIDDIVEWSTCNHIIKGNIFNGELNDYEIEEME